MADSEIKNQGATPPSVDLARKMEAHATFCQRLGGSRIESFVDSWLHRTGQGYTRPLASLALHSRELAAEVGLKYLPLGVDVDFLPWLDRFGADLYPIPWRKWLYGELLHLFSEEEEALVASAWSAQPAAAFRPRAGAARPPVRPQVRPARRAPAMPPAVERTARRLSRLVERIEKTAQGLGVHLHETARDRALSQVPGPVAELVRAITESQPALRSPIEGVRGALTAPAEARRALPGAIGRLEARPPQAAPPWPSREVSGEIARPALSRTVERGLAASARSPYPPAMGRVATFARMIAARPAETPSLQLHLARPEPRQLVVARPTPDLLSPGLPTPERLAPRRLAGQPPIPGLPRTRPVFLDDVAIDTGTLVGLTSGLRALAEQADKVADRVALVMGGTDTQARLLRQIGRRFSGELLKGPARGPRPAPALVEGLLPEAPAVPREAPPIEGTGAWGPAISWEQLVGPTAFAPIGLPETLRLDQEIAKRLAPEFAAALREPRQMRLLPMMSVLLSGLTEFEAQPADASSGTRLALAAHEAQRKAPAAAPVPAAEHFALSQIAPARPVDAVTGKPAPLPPPVPTRSWQLFSPAKALSLSLMLGGVPSAADTLDQAESLVAPQRVSEQAIRLAEVLTEGRHALRDWEQSVPLRMRAEVAATPFGRVIMDRSVDGVRAMRVPFLPTDSLVQLLGERESPTQQPRAESRWRITSPTVARALEGRVAPLRGIAAAVPRAPGVAGPVRPTSVAAIHESTQGRPRAVRRPMDLLVSTHRPEVSRAFAPAPPKAVEPLLLHTELVTALRHPIGVEARGPRRLSTIGLLESETTYRERGGRFQTVMQAERVLVLPLPEGVSRAEIAPAGIRPVSPMVSGLGAWTSAPGIMAAAPGIVAGKPGITAAAPGVTAAAPGVMAAAPGVMAAAPGVMAAAPGVMAAVPGMLAPVRPGITIPASEFRLTGLGIPFEPRMLQARGRLLAAQMALPEQRPFPWMAAAERPSMRAAPFFPVVVSLADEWAASIPLQTGIAREALLPPAVQAQLAAPMRPPRRDLAPSAPSRALTVTRLMQQPRSLLLGAAAAPLARLLGLTTAQAGLAEAPAQAMGLPVEVVARPRRAGVLGIPAGIPAGGMAERGVAPSRGEALAQWVDLRLPETGRPMLPRGWSAPFSPGELFQLVSLVDEAAAPHRSSEKLPLQHRVERTVGQTEAMVGATGGTTWEPAPPAYQRMVVSGQPQVGPRGGGLHPEWKLLDLSDTRIQPFSQGESIHVEGPRMGAVPIAERRGIQLAAQKTPLERPWGRPFASIAPAPWGTFERALVRLEAPAAEVPSRPAGRMAPGAALRAAAPGIGLPAAPAAERPALPIREIGVAPMPRATRVALPESAGFGGTWAGPMRILEFASPVRAARLPGREEPPVRAFAAGAVGIPELARLPRATPVIGFTPEEVARELARERLTAQVIQRAVRPISTPVQRWVEEGLAFPALPEAPRQQALPAVQRALAGFPARMAAPGMDAYTLAGLDFGLVVGGMRPPSAGTGAGRPEAVPIETSILRRLGRAGVIEEAAPRGRETMRTPPVTREMVAAAVARQAIRRGERVGAVSATGGGMIAPRIGAEPQGIARGGAGRQTGWPGLGDMGWLAALKAELTAPGPRESRARTPDLGWLRRELATIVRMGGTLPLQRRIGSSMEPRGLTAASNLADLIQLRQEGQEETRPAMELPGQPFVQVAGAGGRARPAPVRPARTRLGQAPAPPRSLESGRVQGERMAQERSLVVPAGGPPRPPDVSIQPLATIGGAQQTGRGPERAGIESGTDSPKQEELEAMAETILSHIRHRLEWERNRFGG